MSCQSDERSPGWWPPVLITLGRRRTIRVIVVPGEHLVARGPYRFFRHPNYAVVCGEVAVVPLAPGLPVYALLFTLFNAAVLATRIPEENAGTCGGKAHRQPANRALRRRLAAHLASAIADASRCMIGIGH